MGRIEGTTLASEIGARLRSIREYNGWKQKDLADRIGVSASQLSRYESGTILPSVETLLLICEELDISMADLVQGKRVLAIDIPLRDATRAVERLEANYRSMAVDFLIMVLTQARQDGVREKKKESK